jgi:hypothetical protein
MSDQQDGLSPLATLLVIHRLVSAGFEYLKAFDGVNYEDVENAFEEAYNQTAIEINHALMVARTQGITVYPIYTRIDELMEIKNHVGHAIKYLTILKYGDSAAKAMR